MRVLLVASNDDRAQTMRGLLTASESHAFDVVYASSGWEAQQFSADGALRSFWTAPWPTSRTRRCWGG
jgi:hypothetical protein